MLKTLTISIAALLFCCTTPAFAQDVTLKPDAPTTYTVQKGDTLWDISGMYLAQPWLWPQLWKLNPQLDNPHLIFPGDVLSLTFDANGKPVLTVNADAKVFKLSPDTQGAMSGREVSAVKNGMQRLSPKIRKTLKASQAVTTLPLTMIRPFLTYEQALSDAQIATLPYVLGSNEAVKNTVREQVLYVRGDLPLGASYGIYRKGKAYVDPQTQENLGYETILVGTGRVFRAGSVADKQPASVEVLDVKQEIRQGDRLIPAADGQTLPAFFVMAKPEQPVEGVIIDTTSDLREFAKWDIVVLNKGQQDALKAGHMFSIYRQSPAVVDNQGQPVYLADASRYERLTGGLSGDVYDMPKEKVGQLMVFKVSEKTSFAIVTSTLRPVRVGDLIGDI